MCRAHCLHHCTMPMNNPDNSITLHANCVALGNSAVLIRGAAGCGKSAISLQLIAYGATLIADDRTIVTSGEYGLTASCPKPIIGMIEAHGIGILAADTQPGAVLRLVVDLDQTETDRLPVARKFDLLGHSLPLLYAVEGSHFPAAILQYLKGGKSA